MPVNPEDYEYQDPNPYSNPLDNAQEDREWFDSTSKKNRDEPPFSTMSGTSMSAPYMMMIIFQIRMLFQQLESQGIPKHILRTAVYTLLRIQLNEAVITRPGTEESLATAVEDVQNFNDVADCLFAAYAKDRSLCRDGLTQILKGDNFSITLEMSSPNSQENVSGQSL